jgi:CRP-like cAMP-binding protein
MYARAQIQDRADALRSAFGAPPATALEDAFDALFPQAITLWRRAGEEIFGEGEAADFVYQVVTGAVRTYRILSDGRRQICEFHLAGDFLGLEAVADHGAAAEGMTDVVLRAVRRSAISNLATTDAGLARRLWELAVDGMRRSQNHASILGRLGATERVAAFLVDFAERVAADAEMELPMTRQDIADYLGLTIHTVSRTLSQLQDLGLIDARSSRRVQLRRLSDLAELCT